MNLEVGSQSKGCISAVNVGQGLIGNQRRVYWKNPISVGTLDATEDPGCPPNQIRMHTLVKLRTLWYAAPHKIWTSGGLMLGRYIR